MSKSNFKVKCPYCGKITDFGENEDWDDDLIDDSDTTIIDCKHCDYPMEITTHATYVLEVEPYDENVAKTHQNPYEDY